ncbi:MAG: hypothetical protein ABIN11_06010 [candidate division WOR-3 bacterium]
MKAKVKKFFVFFVVSFILIIFFIVSIINFRFFIKHLQIIKDFLTVLQLLTIIIISIFSAWWTYKTFGEKERREEIRKIKKTIMDSLIRVVNYIETTKLVEKKNKDLPGFPFKCRMELRNLIVPIFIELETLVYFDKNKKEKLKNELFTIASYENVKDYIIDERKDVKLEENNPIVQKFEEWIRLIN